MNDLTVFLNELSLTVSEDMTREQLVTPVLATIRACREARVLRPGLVISGSHSLLGLVFQPGHLSLSAILGGGQYTDEWRFIAAMEELRAGGQCDYESIVATESVCFLGQPSAGMICAVTNDSAIVSFSANGNWEHEVVQAERHTKSELGEVNQAPVSIRNISNAAHVTFHQEWIRTYARIVAASSLVYEGDGFVIRMFFDDHEPPHFHVMLRRDTSFYVAKISIETFDLLEGKLTSPLRGRIIGWARKCSERLMDNWRRCRQQLHPFTIEDA